MSHIWQNKLECSLCLEEFNNTLDDTPVESPPALAVVNPLLASWSWAWTRDGTQIWLYNKKKSFFFCQVKSRGAFTKTWMPPSLAIDTRCRFGEPCACGVTTHQEHRLPRCAASIALSKASWGSRFCGYLCRQPTAACPWHPHFMHSYLMLEDLDNLKAGKIFTS